MEVLVFKTNVQAEEQVSKIKPVLSGVKLISDWNFDLDDCDRILRVVVSGLHPRFIESLLEMCGFYCRELED